MAKKSLTRHKAASMTKKTSKVIIGILIVCALVLITPRVLHGYSMNVVNVALLFSITAFGISILLGMGGQMSFAAVSFMGGGAYFIANMCTSRFGINMPTLPALLVTPVIFAGVGFLIGLLLFKLKGTYFTFATIALVQVTYAFYNNYKPLFGGADGISNIPTLNLFGYKFTGYNTWFYAIAVIVIIVALAVERIRRSQLGRALASIRDNETAALTLGVNTYITKVIAFSIAAALASLSGALWCMHNKFVGADMFNYLNAAQFIIMAMLGGVNNTIGIVVGSILVKCLPEFLRSFQKFMQLFWGISIIVLMVFMPSGLAGIKDMIVEKLRGRKAQSQSKGGDGVHAANPEA